MNTESLAFIQTLFARVAVGAIALTTLPTGLGSAYTYHVPLKRLTTLAQAVERVQQQNAAGQVNVLVGMATRRPGLTRYQRGGKANLVALPALFADIDRPPTAMEAALARFRPAPSLVVASGFGTHLYWLLAEPTTQWQEADRLLAGLAQALSGDRLTVAQSMRLPGTQNLKAGRGPCHLLACVPQRWYTLADFSAYRPQPPTQKPMHLPAGTYLDELAQAIAGILLADYGGHRKANGWIAARCPAGHTVDYPGKHFYFNQALRLGHCFGAHGRMLLKDLKLFLHQYLG